MKGPSHGHELMLKGSPAGGTAIRHAGVERDRLRPTPKKQCKSVIIDDHKAQNTF